MRKPNIVIVMPAYNAAKTIQKTIQEIPKNFTKHILVVDDHSTDKTARAARRLGLTVFRHPQNLGYGGNQKTCYWEALKLKPDVVVMLHPDYQYDARLLPDLVQPILSGRYDFMFGSRVRTRSEALKGGMPKHKYLFNRLYTLLANLVLGVNFTEHMSGLRAYSAKTLKKVPFQRFSNDFIFDQQFTLSAIAHNLRVGEIAIPTRYYDDSSSIQFFSGLKFGIQSLVLLSVYVLHQLGVVRSKLFS